ncbi:MAG: hypothetical protein Tsb0016_18620 [Sphingomonadales bacterium]
MRLAGKQPDQVAGSQRQTLSANEVGGVAGGDQITLQFRMRVMPAGMPVLHGPERPNNASLRRRNIQNFMRHRK